MSDRIAILGLGLMGGSLGLGVRRLPGPRPTVRGYARRPETRHAALEMGVVDEVFDDPAECCDGADLIVLCVPILAMSDLLEQCLPRIMPKAIVTDVGSTKRALCESLTHKMITADAVFVGSHPIAGSDEAGIEASCADLYIDSLVVITPTAGTSASDVERTSQFWKQLGARVINMSPEQHDQMLARTSHLPHLAAAVMTQAVLRDDGVEASAFCGSGFRDSTRIAGGSEDIWLDIVQSNRDAILKELAAMTRELEAFRSHVAEGDSEAIRTYLREARLKRHALPDTRDERSFRSGEGAHE